MSRAGARALGAGALLAGSLLLPGARAQSKGDDQPDFMRAKIVATRRHGFTAGLAFAPATVWARGTPTAYARRTREYELVLGPTIAPSLSGYLGYAIADELSFTVAFEPSLYARDDVKISGASAALRVECWPFVSLGGALRDLGVVGRAGLGSAKATRASTGEPLASSGGYSLLGLDLIWDAVRFHGLGLGPTVGVTHRSSATWTQTDLLVGVRVVLYGGP